MGCTYCLCLRICVVFVVTERGPKRDPREREEGKRKETMEIQPFKGSLSKRGLRWFASDAVGRKKTLCHTKGLWGRKIATEKRLNEKETKTRGVDGSIAILFFFFFLSLSSPSSVLPRHTPKPSFSPLPFPPLATRSPLRIDTYLANR